MKPRIYLASPYSHKDKAVMQHRFEETRKVTSSLISGGFIVFSPIVYAHAMAEAFAMPRNHKFWKEFNGYWLAWATQLWVLTLPGWVSSLGVLWEMAEARKFGLDITYYDPETGVLEWRS